MRKAPRATSLQCLEASYPERPHPRHAHCASPGKGGYRESRLARSLADPPHLRAILRGGRKGFNGGTAVAFTLGDSQTSGRARRASTPYPRGARSRLWKGNVRCREGDGQIQEWLSQAAQQRAVLQRASNMPVALAGDDGKLRGYDACCRHLCFHVLLGELCESRPANSRQGLVGFKTAGLPPMNLLGRISIRNAKIVQDPHGQDVLHVQESRTYVSLTPTLFRGIGHRQSSQSARVRDRNIFIDEIVQNSTIFSTFPDYSHEPLLQHYGLSTTWIDLVDNIWVALWFSCHKAHVSGRMSQYLHFERRIPAPTNEEFAYILLVAADAGQTGAPGLFKGPHTELVDLRVACPSIFLRPHAQHGVLFRKRGKGVIRPIDYSDQIRVVIRISLSDALSWLGEAKTLGVHALFPPPYYDHGYRILLDGRFENRSRVGSIFVVGA